MFIKKLWKYNKLYTVLVAVFLAAYFFINFKHGITTAPIYQYGMFSGKFSVTDTQTIFKIVINQTDTLDFNKLNYVQRDKISYFLEKAPYINEGNAKTYLTVKNIFSKFGLGTIINERKNNCDLKNAQTEEIILQLLENVTQTKINSYKVYQQFYAYNGKLLTPASQIQLIYSNNGK